MVTAGLHSFRQSYYLEMGSDFSSDLFCLLPMERPKSGSGLHVTTFFTRHCNYKWLISGSRLTGDYSVIKTEIFLYSSIKKLVVARKIKCIWLSIH